MAGFKVLTLVVAPGMAVRGGDRSVSGGPSGEWKWTSTLPERGAVGEKEEYDGEERSGAQIRSER